jgi:hypothetical protein
MLHLYRAVLGCITRLNAATYRRPDHTVSTETVWAPHPAITILR